MKVSFTRSIVLCCSLSLFIAAGCAKKELVKSDQMTPPPAPTAPPTTAQPAQPAQPDQGVKDQPVQEAPTKAEAQPTPAAPSAEQVKAAFEAIYFEFDSYLLSDTARQALVKNRDILNGQPNSKITIQGNCDERGSDEYNLALGEKRARAAKEYLVTLGIPANRIATISYGNEKPVDPGHDEAAWAKNRRDDFVITK